MRAVQTVLLAFLSLLIIVIVPSCCESQVNSGSQDVLARLRNDLKSYKQQVFDLEEERDSCLDASLALRSKVSELETQLTAIDSHSEEMQLAKADVELVRKELEIAQNRLHVCETTSKTHASRESTCKQDLELAHLELQAATLREAEAEKTLRKNDCSAAKRDLRTYRDLAEQSEIEKDALQRKINELEGSADVIRELEARLEEADEATLDAEEAEKVAMAELTATKKALESLLESLDTRRQYEELLKQHNQEWLPHWLETTLSPVYHVLGSIFREINIRTIQPALHWVESSIISIHPGCKGIKMALEKRIQAAKVKAAVLYSEGTAKVHRIEHIAEEAVIKQLHKMPSLRQAAHHDVVHVVIWAFVASFALPLGYIIMRSIALGLLHQLRPGTASIKAPPAAGSGLKRLEEEMLGNYRFQNADHLLRAFRCVRDSTNISHYNSSIAQLGRQLAGVAIAEEQHAKNQSKNTHSVEAALIHKANQNGVTSTFVTAGPGRKSHKVRHQRGGELFAAVLGAVYLDSNGDMTAVKRAWGVKEE